MYLLDSNVLIALFRKDETNHQDVSTFFKEVTSFAITDHVLSEVATILKIKEGVKIAKKAMELLIKNKDVLLLQLNPAEIEGSSKLFLKSPKISFVDASLIVLAKDRDFELVTLDKAMVKAAKSY